MCRPAWIFILICLSLACSHPSEQVSPNIILIVTDDQGWGDLSIHGNRNLSTPHLDQLAQEGVSLDRFYVCPVCSPTRAELMTGRYHPRTGVSGTSRGEERLDLDETTIADIFQQAGYSTAAYGKWHNGMQAPYHPNSRGFEDFYGFCSGHWGNYFDPMLEHNGEIVTGNGYLIDDFTDHGISFIERNKDRPFFLYLPYNTPHRPMQVPDRWWDTFKDKEIGMRHQDSTREILQHTRAALAMCENIDWNVGRILTSLKELNLEENTIVLFMSDNGPNKPRWNGGMTGIKGSTDEGGVRSPLFIRWTDHLPAGTSVSHIAGAIDLMPTLADLAGIPLQLDKDLDGLSLLPLLQEKSKEWPDRMLFSYWRDKLSVRSQQFRLDHKGNLFDMEQDPGQQINVAEKFPQEFAALAMAKQEWKEKVLSELPEQDNRPIPLGHPDLPVTQIPARDGTASGGIKRSSPSPNCSFFTHWTHTEEDIHWEVDVQREGHYEVEVYFTCAEADTGSVVVLSAGADSLMFQINQAHDPPLRGMEEDRYPRGNSYVKDWARMKIGNIHLKQGRLDLRLRALDIPGETVMDFRLLMFRSI